MKKIVSLILILVLSLSVGMVYAAPDTVSPEDLGTTNNLISVLTPENLKDSTADETYIVSGMGVTGAVLTFYKYDEVNKVYTKIFVPVSYVDQLGTSVVKYNEATITVGETGRFINTVSLVNGKNNILIRAEHNGFYQIVKLDLTKNSAFIEAIKNLLSI